jgi:hypothetical protein
MRARLLVVAIVLITLPAFAPAPKPKPGRPDQGLKALSGLWVANDLEAEIADGKYTYFRPAKGAPNVLSKTSAIIYDASKNPA